MHPLFVQASELTRDVIGAAIEVHKDKGPGLLESIYEWCLTTELQLRGHRVQEYLLRFLSSLMFKKYRKPVFVNAALLFVVHVESHHGERMGGERVAESRLCNIQSSLHRYERLRAVD
jgi:hypothetical protein